LINPYQYIPSKAFPTYSLFLLFNYIFTIKSVESFQSVSRYVFWHCKSYLKIVENFFIIFASKSRRSY